MNQQTDGIKHNPICYGTLCPGCIEEELMEEGKTHYFRDNCQPPYEERLFAEEQIKSAIQGSNKDQKDLVDRNKTWELEWRDNLHKTIKKILGELPQIIIDSIDSAYLQGLEDKEAYAKSQLTKLVEDIPDELSPISEEEVTYHRMQKIKQDLKDKWGL